MFFNLIARSIAICFLLTAVGAPGRTLGQIKPKPGKSVSPSFSVGASVDDFFERAEAFGFSGSVIVANGDQVVLRKAYGYSDRRNGVANRPSTVFSLASLDKQFIAAAILRLEEMGKLRTTDSISRFFNFVPEEKSAITLHHLLSHTAGIRNEYWDSHPEMSRQAFVRLVLHDQPLLSQPGKEWRYSNSGYIVLEEVIEQVSGKPYEVFLQESLFGPAGMTHTGNPSRQWDARNVAKYQYWTVDPPKISPDAADLLTRPRSNWVLMSTIDDMYRWYLALRSNRVLTPESKKKLFNVVMADYAYGFNVVRTARGTKLIHHGGSGSDVGMVATFRWFVDEGVFVCVLSNSVNPSLSADYFMGDVESLIFGGTPSLPPAKDSGWTGDPDKLVGTYTFPNGASFEVCRAKDGRLAILTRDKRAMVFLRFPDAAARPEAVSQDAVAIDVIRGIAHGDYEPLRKILAKQVSFDATKSFFERAKGLTASFGELRSVSTVYQRSFVFDGQLEIQSFVRLEYEKGDLVLRVLHRPSGEITLNAVNMPDGVEGVLTPTIGGGYSTWDFTLGNGAQIVFNGESTPVQLTVRGPHGSIVATKHSN